MDAIETREIRGLSAQSLKWLVGSTITVVGFILSSYFLLRSDIENIQNQKLSDDRYNDLKMKVMEAKIDAVSITVDNLRNQVSTNKQSIETLKK